MHLSLCFGLLALFADVAFATIAADIRYDAANALPNTVRNSLYWSQDESSSFRARLGSRLGVSDRVLEDFTYSASLSYVPYPWFETEARMTHVNHLNENVAWTTLLLQGKMQTPALFVQGYGAFGAYRRSLQIHDTLILPTWLSSYSEWDLTATLGVRVNPSATWSTTLAVSTVEILDVYNLNHPFLESTLKYSPKAQNWAATAFYRYELLLGFGRMDGWVVGAALEWR